MIRINQLVEEGKLMKNTFRELQFVIRLLIWVWDRIPHDKPQNPKTPKPHSLKNN